MMKEITVLFVFLLLYFKIFAQPPHNWQTKDLKDDGLFGVSADKAYKTLLKGKVPNKIIVAIVDSGIDTLHEDLRDALWVGGDGGHGWNYIAGETGREDVTLLTGNRQDFYDSLSYTSIPEMYKTAYQLFRKMQPALQAKIGDMQRNIRNLQAGKKVLDEMILKIGKNDPDLEDFVAYCPGNEDEKLIRNLVVERWPLYGNMKKLVLKEIDNPIHLSQYHIEHGLNVKNNEQDTANGNCDISPDVLGLLVKPNSTAYHGTHVAGIIGAVRNNGIGIDGIADNAKL